MKQAGRVRVLLLSAGALVVLCAVAFVVFRGDRSFPNLPPGIYTGTLHGIDGGSTATLYIERPSQEAVLLVVLFLDDFRPQATAAGSPRADGSFSPIRVSYRANSLELWGRLQDGGARGRFRGSNGEGGRWEVRKTEERELHRGVTELELREWLTARREERKLREQLRLLEEDLVEKSKKRERLAVLLGNEEMLKERAAHRREEISGELQSGIDERKDTARIVADLVSELDLLARITKKGQAITLARRVAHRENKWYEVNWQAAEDLSDLEDGTGLGTELDLRKLDQAAAHAEEVRALLRERNAELERIRALERMAAEPPAAQPTPAERGPREDKSLWDRIFGG